MDLDGLVAKVDGQLRARVVPGRAEHEKAYLKSGLEHYGVPGPAIRAVAKGVRKLHPDLSHGPLGARRPTAAAGRARGAVDDDFWIRRSALLALLESLRRGGATSNGSTSTPTRC